MRNRPSFWGNLFKAGTVCEYSVGPAFSGDFRLGLYFSLQHDVWSRTMKALFVLSMSHCGGKRLGLSVNG